MIITKERLTFIVGVAIFTPWTVFKVTVFSVIVPEYKT
jgi:biotin transporter BioY